MAGRMPTLPLLPSSLFLLPSSLFLLPSSLLPSSLYYGEAVVFLYRLMYFYGNGIFAPRDVILVCPVLCMLIRHIAQK